MIAIITVKLSESKYNLMLSYSSQYCTKYKKSKTRYFQLKTTNANVQKEKYKYYVVTPTY